MSEFTEKFKKETWKGYNFIEKPISMEKYSRILCKNYSEYFTEWWDPDKFDWVWSEYLAKYCSSDFDKWFDPKKFDWDYSEYLVQYCSSDILVWFDKEKIDYTILDPCSIVLLKKHGKLGE